MAVSDVISVFEATKEITVFYMVPNLVIHMFVESRDKNERERLDVCRFDASDRVLCADRHSLVRVRTDSSFA